MSREMFAWMRILHGQGCGGILNPYWVGRESGAWPLHGFPVGPGPVPVSYTANGGEPE